jgi:lipopolysaccharide biosynthesis regulator YciM
MAKGPKYGSAEARIRRAFQAFLGGDLDGAEHELTELVRADSNDAVAYLTLAHLYRERGEVGRALRVHQNLLLRSDLDPALRSRVQSALAADLRAGGLCDRAVAAYEEVLSAEPKRADAIEALVDLHVESGNYAAAIEVQRRTGGWFRSGDPKREAQLLIAMATHEHEEGRGDEARKLARKASKLDAGATRAYILLGEIETERAKPKAALAAWSEAVTSAAAADAAGDVDGAAIDRVWEHIGAAHAAIKRGDGGEAFARKHLETHPRDGAAQRALARALVARGDIDGALAELRAILEHDPSDGHTRAQLGRLLLDEKRNDEALDAYRDWIETHSNPARDSDVGAES